jgi:prefoldin subunit 5
VSAPEIMAAEGQAKLLPSARIGAHNGEPHAIVALPDGSDVRVLLHAGENITETLARRRKNLRQMIDSLQRELDQLDTAIGIVARESHA